MEYVLDSAAVNVGDGYSLSTSHPALPVQVDSSAGTRGFASDPFDVALSDNGLRLDKVIQVPAIPTPAAVDRDLTDARTARPLSPTLTIDITPGEGESVILLVEDNATHALSWVIPQTPEQPPASGARALRVPLRFEVPIRAPAKTGTRDFSVADLTKKISSFVYKITDPLLGPIIHGFARKWETKHRPSFIRLFGPDNYQVDDPDFPRVDEPGWRSLGQGRALLFVHGTFSTCGTFAPLGSQTFSDLSSRYGGRIFAFNHPTLTADPRENAIAFLSAMPTGMPLEIDIVCHSRGGLVAREIAALGQAQGQLTVRNVVFVAATNHGTVLADADHMVDMIDRFTTIAKFLPAGTAAKIVDALVLAIKIIGHGFLNDLEGLKAMDPTGPFMTALNVSGPPGPNFFAMASDYEPPPSTPFVSMARLENAAVDRIFSQVANDLVVPRDGVFAANGAVGFPIGTGRCLLFGPGDGVIHTEFFKEQKTAQKLLEWLQPAGADERGLMFGPSLDQVARSFDFVKSHALATLARSRGNIVTSAAPFSPAELESLRPHVITLKEGQFDQGAVLATSQIDVDAIFGEHIPKWAAAVQPAEKPLRIVVWAHGGLVGQTQGLKIAQKHVQWWKENGVFPIYFVWETGLFDALRSILESVARKLPGLGTRDLFDFTTDPLVQDGVRALGGAHVWSAMKSFAQIACGPEGPARYVARKLAQLALSKGGIGNRPLELHAVGHSAGSNFQSWFLPAAREESAPTFSTLQLLAPAITIPEFRARLGDDLRNYATRSVIYTMKKSFEEADDCIGIYHKSLLYLIHHALETERRTAILGLEISLRSDSAVATQFGLNGATNSPGGVVWSVTDDGKGNSSSRSVHHGDFDNDPVTMNSVAANVLNADQAIVPYIESVSRSLDGWPVSDSWLAGIDLSAAGSGLLASTRLPAIAKTGVSNGPAPENGSGGVTPGPGAPPAPKPGPKSSPGTAGTRSAVCVGIDNYPPPNTLTGCVGDTRLWSEALRKLDFNVTTVLNEEATHDRILQELRTLMANAKRGDVLVFHYSGHGVKLPAPEGAPAQDDGNEAMVPVDFAAGAFLVDDDTRQVLDLLPEGVSLTVFADCCHSGTITRVLGSPAGAIDVSRARFLKPTEDWDQWMDAHERFREHIASTRTSTVAPRSLHVNRNAMRWVNFSACQAKEVAMESDGNGAFSRIASRLLTGDVSQYTQRSFQDAIIAAFGPARQQTPDLDAPDSLMQTHLLQPLD